MMFQYSFLFVIFFYLQTFAQTQEEVKPPAENEVVSLEDAPPPVDTKKTTDASLSIFDEEEGMLVKKLTMPFEYDRQAKRDPFRLPEVSAVEIPLGGYFGPFLELQEVQLESIKIKALILDPVRPKAVVAFKNNDDKEVSRKIHVGDYIGENFGRVHAIRENQIVVIQTFVEGQQKSTTMKTLNIRK
jgi:Tfp pilus assembly protein PilP